MKFKSMSQSGSSGYNNDVMREQGRQKSRQAMPEDWVMNINIWIGQGVCV